MRFSHRFFFHNIVLILRRDDKLYNNCLLYVLKIMNISKCLNKFIIKTYYCLRFIIKNIENEIYNVIIIYVILI